MAQNILGKGSTGLEPNQTINFMTQETDGPTEFTILGKPYKNTAQLGQCILLNRIPHGGPILLVKIGVEGTNLVNYCHGGVQEGPAILISHLDLNDQERELLAGQEITVTAKTVVVSWEFLDDTKDGDDREGQVLITLTPRPKNGTLDVSYSVHPKHKAE